MIQWLNRKLVVIGFTICKSYFAPKNDPIVASLWPFIQVYETPQVGTELGRPGTALRAASLRPRTIEKGLGKRAKWARTGPSSLECLRPSRGKLGTEAYLDPHRIGEQDR